MTLEERVAKALRLSSAAAEKLKDEINANIQTARAELIRMGCQKDVAESEHVLVQEAIVTYCQKEMGAPDLYERYEGAWLFQAENIRRSTLEAGD